MNTPGGEHKGAEVRAELLSPDELNARIAEAAIAYLPLGSLEFHGPHLPIGLDALTAHGVCVGSAQISGGIVLPAHYYGTGGDHASYPWTVMMPSPLSIAEQLTQTLDRLEHVGVRRAIIFTGHFAIEQLAMIDAIAEEWNRASKRAHVIATSVDRCPALPIPPDHAGNFETTLLHALSPELVHIDRLPTRLALDPGGNAWGNQRHDPEHALWGVFGSDPRQADLATSDSLLRSIVAWLSGLACPDRGTGEDSA